MVESIDILLRFVATGASLLLLTLLVFGRVRVGIKVPLAGLLVGAIAYLLTTAPAFREAIPRLAHIDLASISVPFWLWLLSRRLFERDPPTWLSWSLAAIIFSSWYAGEFLVWTRPAGFYILHVVGLVLVGDIFRVSLTGRDDDLIEKRRMMRLWLPILIGLQAGGILLIELILQEQAELPALQLINTVLILALTLFSGLVLLKPDPELLIETGSEKAPSDHSDDLTPVEAVIKEKLDAAMSDHLYRRPGLTIASLAQHLETPEHRLRALINKRLGHRNFSAFLNGHRIAEARQILTDKSHVDLPVLTIAMDLGYNSLATFNRAFRSETGMTPTDYRRSQLAVASDQN